MELTSKHYETLHLGLFRKSPNTIKQCTLSFVMSNRDRIKKLYSEIETGEVDEGYENRYY